MWIDMEMVMEVNAIEINEFQPRDRYGELQFYFDNAKVAFTSK